MFGRVEVEDIQDYLSPDYHSKISWWKEIDYWLTNEQRPADDLLITTFSNQSRCVHCTVRLLLEEIGMIQLSNNIGMQNDVV